MLAISFTPETHMQNAPTKSTGMGKDPGALSNNLRLHYYASDHKVQTLEYDDFHRHCFLRAPALGRGANGMYQHFVYNHCFAL